MLIDRSAPALLVFLFASCALSQTTPVTFSVNGRIDNNTAGLHQARGGFVGAPYSWTRTPAPIARAVGIDSLLRPGDVHDYWAGSFPSDAELFQSEPEGGPPAGTNNQILVAAELGLVAGQPGDFYHDNVDAVSFGEDYFGVTSVSGYLPTNQTAWHLRPLAAFAEPVVTGDSGTSFRLTVDPWAIGTIGTALRAQSGGADVGAGTGLWSSPSAAAGDIFETFVLTRPGAVGSWNGLVFDQPLLGLAGANSAGLGINPYEDDVDALECVGNNFPGSWTGGFGLPLDGGDLFARLGGYPGGVLGAPGAPVFYMQRAPIFFSVDRNSKGAARSAVRTQALWSPSPTAVPHVPEAAGDIFMAFHDLPCFFGGVGCSTNYLFLDEKELGLLKGAAGITTDDLDALIIDVHPDDRYPLLELIEQNLYNLHSQFPNPYDHDPNPAIVGDEYRTGPGFDYSLFQYWYEVKGTFLRVRVGFSVTTDSVGATKSAVDFEAGMKPTMQQSGDIFFTQFGDWGNGMGIVNPEPLADGVNYLWYQETEIGLSAGSWVPGTSTNLAQLPDELNGLDSIDTPDLVNDSCAAAIPIAEDIPVVGSNTSATTGPDPVGTCGLMMNDVWYTFVPTCTTTYKVTTCDVGTNYDSVVAVWSGPCGGLAQLACNDDNCGIAGNWLNSTTTFPATAGVTYHVSVGGYNGLTGNFTLTITRSPLMGLTFTYGVPGSIGYNVSSGPSNGTSFTAMTLNHGAFPNGWLFGIDITLADLSSELSSGFPFFVPLTPCGTGALVPIPGLPTGLTLYGVAIGLPPGSSVPSAHSAPASGTVQ